uniref:Uncharacterized protein n=1 Tax=Arundo donax TaxID=35708 RepID=A0A0A8YQE9_ARUDO
MLPTLCHRRPGLSVSSASFMPWF